MYYTLGQRQGLRIGGRSDAGDEPWYVVDKDLGRNVLVVVQGHDHPSLQSHRLIASQITWVAGDAPAAVFRCAAKVRYRQADQACEVRMLETGRLQGRVRRAAARDHAGAIRGVLPRRGVPRRRRDRGVSRAARAAIIRALCLPGSPVRGIPRPCDRRGERSVAELQAAICAEYRCPICHIFYPRPCKR